MRDIGRKVLKDEELQVQLELADAVVTVLYWNDCMIV